MIDIKDFIGKGTVDITIRNEDKTPRLYLSIPHIKKLNIEDGVIKEIELYAQFDTDKNYVVIERGDCI